jgi:hypothetical protein
MNLGANKKNKVLLCQQKMYLFLGVIAITPNVFAEFLYTTPKTIYPVKNLGGYNWWWKRLL